VFLVASWVKRLMSFELRLAEARAVGPPGMITGLSDALARQGMGVMLELLKGLDRAPQGKGG
jgi:hypothetical protein